MRAVEPKRLWLTFASVGAGLGKISDPNVLGTGHQLISTLTLFSSYVMRSWYEAKKCMWYTKEWHQCVYDRETCQSLLITKVI